jgi:hypothetical protein
VLRAPRFGRSPILKALHEASNAAITTDRSLAATVMEKPWREAALKDKKGDMLDGALKTVASLDAGVPTPH